MMGWWMVEVLSPKFKKLPLFSRFVLNGKSVPHEKLTISTLQKSSGANHLNDKIIAPRYLYFMTEYAIINFAIYYSDAHILCIWMHVLARIKTSGIKTNICHTLSHCLCLRTRPINCYK